MIKLLKILKILDADGTLSLSYVCLIAAIIKLCMTADVYSMGFLLLSLVNLNAKKGFSYLFDKKDLNDMEKLDELKAQMIIVQNDIAKLNSSIALANMRR